MNGPWRLASLLALCVGEEKDRERTERGREEREGREGERGDKGRQEEREGRREIGWVETGRKKKRELMACQKEGESGCRLPIPASLQTTPLFAVTVYQK